MSLNKIELKGHHLTSMFGHVLIDTAINKPVENEAAPLKILGKNAKNILVLVKDSTCPFLPDQELKFLTSVLSACKLSLGDIALLNAYTLNEKEIPGAINTLEARHILAFGIEPLELGLPFHFPDFQVQPFDKRSYMHAPALSHLESDKNLKKELWTALKNMFNLQ